MAKLTEAGRLQVLIVDGQFVRAMTLHELLVRAGMDPVGPFGHAMLARRAADRYRINGALLGTGISGEDPEPVADLLKARSIPFLTLQPTDVAATLHYRVGELMGVISAPVSSGDD